MIKTYPEKILEFATKAHEGQIRKFTKVPYITHPIVVAEFAVEIAKEYGYVHEVTFNQVRSIAYLHDVIEDTNITFEELSDFLDSLQDLSLVEKRTILLNVKLLTKPIGTFDLIDDYLYKIKLNRYSQIVKLADLKHNMSDLKERNQKSFDKYRLIEFYLKY